MNKIFIAYYTKKWPNNNSYVYGRNLRYLHPAEAGISSIIQQLTQQVTIPDNFPGLIADLTHGLVRFIEVKETDTIQEIIAHKRRISSPHRRRKQPIAHKRRISSPPPQKKTTAAKSRYLKFAKTNKKHQLQ